MFRFSDDELPVWFTFAPVYTCPSKEYPVVSEIQNRFYFRSGYYLNG